jgi:protein-S-isoprenylcysteine O-methyltransferase Ste14
LNTTVHCTHPETTHKSVTTLKADAAVAIASTICLILAIYTAMLSTQITDDTTKKIQTVTTATYLLIAGITIFLSYLATVTLRKTIIKHPHQTLHNKPQTQN